MRISAATGSNVTTGNVATNDRVSLFLMDYVNRRRLKIFGKMRTVSRDEDASLMTRLAVANYRAVIERAALIKVEAFSWNCPQHITRRYTQAELADLLQRSRRSRHVAETCEPK